MGTLAQTVLPFKLEATDGMLAANAGLTLSVEFIQGPGFSCWLAQEMPKPGSGRGYEAPVYVKPLMLTGGWLCRTGAGDGMAGLSRLNQQVVATRIQQTGITTRTLDGDTGQAVSPGRKSRISPARGNKATCP